jgi:hypothetical protein
LNHNPLILFKIFKNSQFFVLGSNVALLDIMKTLQFSPQAVSALAFITLISSVGCSQGASPQNLKSKNLTILDPQISSGQTIADDYVVQVQPTPVSSSQPATESPSVVDPIPFKFTATGYSAIVKIKVQVNKILKIKFSALVPDRAMSNGQYAYYAHLGVHIGVGTGAAVPTGMMSNGFSDAAQDSAVMDFSNSFDHTCAESDLKCRQEVEITISRPNYDFICLNFPTSVSCQYPYYSNVYSPHPWTGRIKVQTDDTRSFN